MIHAEILAIGDEITSGQTLDTNSKWLSEQLEGLGIRVLYHSTVGDEFIPCQNVFRQAIERSEIVIATGGLGPTADDLTREVLAGTVDRQLVLYPEAIAHIQRLFTLRNREMPEQNALQALFPEGSRMIPNPNGTAPGIDLEIPRNDAPPCRFFALPGVPIEMREMWESYLKGELQKLVGGTRKIVRRKINCFGAGESQLEAMLPDIIRRGRTPTVGITASDATISLRISAEGTQEEECLKLIEPTVQIIRDCLGNLIFGEGDEQLQHIVVKRLLEKQQTLAVVEWGTGGLVTEWLSAVSGSEKCFLGGIVTPNSMAFERHFSISPTPLNQSSECETFLKGMVVSLRKHLQADWLIMTGSIPDDSCEKPLPIHLALANSQDAKVLALTPIGPPPFRKIYGAKHALNWLRLELNQS